MKDGMIIKDKYALRGSASAADVVAAISRFGEYVEGATGIKFNTWATQSKEDILDVHFVMEVPGEEPSAREEQIERLKEQIEIIALKKVKEGLEEGGRDGEGRATFKVDDALKALRQVTQ